MNAMLFLLILISVCLSASAQIVLKLGMSHNDVIRSIAADDPLSIIFTVAMNPGVILGLSLYFLGAVAWLAVLSKVDVSYAYPFVGLGFILTMILGAQVLGEPVTLARIAGTILVSTGVFLVART